MSSPTEGSVDVFKQNYAAFWSIGEEVVELVVCQASFGEVEDTNVVFEGAGKGLNE